MKRIKNFKSFKLNESVDTDVEEIKSDISDRLMDLGTSVDLVIDGLDFRINNIISSELEDVIYCVNWIISYCSSNGYVVELSAGNYEYSHSNFGFLIMNCNFENLDDISEQLTTLFSDLKRLREFEIGRYGNDKESTGYFLKISLKKRL
jgi:hypothetical protein